MSKPSVPRDSQTWRYDSTEQQVFLNLWRTYDCLKAIEAELFDRFALSAQQYNALRLLRSVHPGAMPSQTLGRRLISRGPDTTRMLDRLERRNLIRRIRPVGNRRVVEVSIDAPGISLLDEMAEQVKEMHAKQLGHLTHQDQRDLVRLLRLARQPHDDATCDWLDEESTDMPSFP